MLDRIPVWLRTPLFLIALLAAPFRPFFFGHVPWLGDGLLHLYRLGALELAVADGFWWARWVPSLGYGYGFPLFNYYAPLSYYLVLPLHQLGLSLSISTVVSYSLAIVLLVSAVYLTAKSLWGTLAGMVAAGLIAFSPYILYNLHHRAALAELWGLAWLALGFWAIASSRARVLFIATAGLMLSHNITALIGVPMLGLWGLGAWLHRRKSDQVVQNGIGILAGLGVSAFFWIPALLETDLVQIDRLTDASNFAFSSHFLTILDWVAWPPLADPTLINPQIPITLGIPAAFSLLLGIAGLFRAKSRHWLLAVLVILTLLSLFMTLSISNILWDSLPLISFVQFPWRFLGPAAIGAALLGGYGAQAWLPNTRAWPPALALAVAVAIIGFFALPYLSPTPPPDLPTRVTEAEIARFERETGWLGTTSAADYLPVAVQALPEANAERPRFENGRLTVDVQAEPTTLPIFDYPGWHVTTPDGQQLEIQSSEPNGLISFTPPAGVDTVTLDFRPTPVRRWASIGSILATVLAGVWVSLGNRSPEHKPESPKPEGWGWGLGTLVILPFLVPLVTRSSPIEPNVRLDQNFDNRLMLIGANLPEEPIPADRPIDLDLIWRGLAFDEELSVGVHVLDEFGLLVAQSDHLHPADFPLPRWLPEQIAIDDHQLFLPAGSPPGRYDLRLFVYGADGNRREYLNAGGLPAGVNYPLGSIEIDQPARYPDPEELDLEVALGISIKDEVELVGVTIFPAEAREGEWVTIQFGWLTNRAQSNSHSLDITIGDRQFPITNGPDETWSPGRTQLSTSRFRIPLGDEPGTLPIRIKSDTAEFEIGTVEAIGFSRNFDLPEIETPADLPISFRDQSFATFVGSTIEDCPQTAGSTCQFTLVWQSTDQIDVDLTLFAQLLGPDGRPVAQIDRLPVSDGETRPTPSWLPDEVLTDTLTLQLPDDLPEGPFTLIIGLYNPETGQRATTPTADFVTIPAAPTSE